MIIAAVRRRPASKETYKKQIMFVGDRGDAPLRFKTNIVYYIYYDGWY